MQVGKAKLVDARKDINDGPPHRGHGGARARKARVCKRRIEKAIRQAGRKACQEQ